MVQENRDFFFVILYFKCRIDVVTPAHSVPAEPTPGRVELRVVVSPEILQVQYGQTYELTCGVYGADAATSIYWIQEEPERVKNL